MGTKYITRIVQDREDEGFAVYHVEWREKPSFMERLLGLGRWRRIHVRFFSRESALAGERTLLERLSRD